MVASGFLGSKPARTAGPIQRLVLFGETEKPNARGIAEVSLVFGGLSAVFGPKELCQLLFSDACRCLGALSVLVSEGL